MEKFFCEIKDLKEDEKQKIEEFLKNSSNSYFKQSLNYLNANSFKRYIYYMCKDKKIFLACILNIEKNILGNMLKIYGGPVIDEEIDLEDFSQMLKDILKISKKEKTFLNILSTNFEITKKGFEDRIISSGFITEKEKNKIKERIDYPYYFYIPLEEKDEEDLKKELSSKTRYFIRIAKVKNFTVEKVEIDDEEIETKLKNFKNFNENLEKYIVKKDEEIYAKIYLLNYGSKKYLIDILENEKLEDFEYAKYLGLWEIIKNAKKEKFKEFNLMSFPGLKTKKEDIPPYSMYRFKKSFGGILFEKLPEYIYINNEIKYNMYKMFLKKDKYEK